jgi:Matrixin
VRTWRHFLAEALASQKGLLMRLLLIFSAVLTSMFDVDICLTVDVASAAPRNNPEIAQAGMQPAAPRHYTNHPASTAAPEIVTLQIDGSFNANDRAKVLLAVEEWNHALNGYVRFDVASSGGWRPQAWNIRAERGGSPDAPGSPGGQPLSFTQAGFASIGGKMVIYVDRIGTRDLRGIVLHELGHVLGLDHDPRGNLMSARYSSTTGQCVDKPTAETIAAMRKLPLAGLNWCEAYLQN